MHYVLARDGGSEQEKRYYAGLERKIGGRMVNQVTHSLDHATKFATAADAEAMCAELGGGYVVVSVEGKT